MLSFLEVLLAITHNNLVKEFSLIWHYQAKEKRFFALRTKVWSISWRQSNIIAVNLSKVREVLDSFPELVNDEVGPKRVSFLPHLCDSRC